MALAFDKLRVLVADDNPHMRTILGAILKGLGIRDIREAGSGLQAIHALRDWPADLAIIDYRMEPMNGVEFTKQIRTGADSPNIYLPIIMVTGHADYARVLDAREAGITELVVKPVTADVIVARINAVIFHPRPFAKTETYFGPSRRRRRESDYRGPERRGDRAAHTID